MSLINLDLVINAITSIANPLIKEKILRSETVIKLLRQFKLDPEHPPADFSGVYAYTLVEYGIGKPKPFLELFRQEAIKQACRKALEHHNSSILLSEVDAFLDAYTLGDDIRNLELDVRREVAAFVTLFSEVAQRSRTPADVLMSWQIGSLHDRITNIQEQLERLPTLEGIRTEMARLATQNYPALTGATTENKCRAIALAQQMRGWFETLGYRLEKYEIWAEEYFEWIINVPVRRSYDRILVRGVAGEVGLSDVMALRQSVNQQKTDEGWLVSTRRIARAARDEVKKEENRHLDCFTFDELIDLDADFTGYLDWLEAEIKRRKIDQKYVPLACTKEEIDPVTKRRIGVSRYEAEDGWIDGYIDLWLDDPVKEHISILGEFGTGKTWFVFHYAWTALQRYKDAQRRGVERPRLPLVITLRDFAKALNVENVLAGFFFTQHNIRLNSEVFDQLNRMGKLLLIFDGFDEMAAKVDRQQMINNFWELAKVVVPGSKVILTCRTEHFPEAKEGRALLNAELQASTNKLTGETPQFEVLELEKFNDEQIQQVLLCQAEAATVEQVMGNSQLLDLARRPVMTDLILEALPDIEAGKPIDMSRVYLYAVRRKMERDIKAERTFTSLADKLYFLCELSWEMLSTNEMSLNYKLFPDRIRRLFGVTEKDLDYWHYDMMAQTMLVRNANGDYTPAHRSFLEFLVAYKFAAELGVLGRDFIEIAIAQSCLDENAAPVDYTWSGYFSRWSDAEGNCAPFPALRDFVSEPLEKLRETFGREVLTKAVLDLLVLMVDGEKKEEIIKVLEGTRRRSEDEVGYVGGNAATLAVKLDKCALRERNLHHVLLKKSDFTNAILQNVNFTGATLANSVFVNTLSQIFSVAFNSDGQLLAMGDGANIRLCLISNKKQILTFNGHQNLVYSVAFSPDDQILASAGSDCTIRFWDIKTERCLQILVGHTATVRSVAFSSDGLFLVSGSEDQTVKVWNTKTGICLYTLPKQNGLVRSVSFCPVNETSPQETYQTLAFSASNYTIEIWDLLAFQCKIILKGHKNWVKSIAFSPDGKVIASGSQDCTVKLWDISTGECLRTLQGHTFSINSVAFHSNGQILASSSCDHTIKLWDVNTGQCLKTLQGHANWVQSVTFSPDGQTLASGCQDHAVKLWEIHTGECLYTFQGYANWFKSVVFNSDGQTIASGGQDSIVRLWDLNTGKCTKELQGHFDWIQCLAFSPDGQTIASGGNDCTVRLWDINTGKCTKILKNHNDTIFSIAFSPDGLKLVSGSSDNTIYLWDFVTGKSIHVLKEDMGWVNTVAFSSDGQIIGSCSNDNTVEIWDANTGNYLKCLSQGANWSRSGAFNPDVTIFASCSDDYLVKLWNISTGECLGNLEEHTRQIKALCFSDDGQILATGSDDLTIKLWDISTGNCLITLQGHTGTILSISFSPNNKIISSCGEDGTIRIWNFETGECLKTLRSDRPYERMNITGVKGLTSSEIATLKALGAFEE